jgi:adenylate cyclase
MSYETYALVSDMVVAKRLPPITMKGISREIMPYVVEAIVRSEGHAPVIQEQQAGVSLYLDPSQIDPKDLERIKGVLTAAMQQAEEHIAARAAAKPI